MDKFSKNSKFMKCFITNINVSKEDIEIWCQTDNKLSSRVESAIDSLHNHLSDMFAITSQNLRPALIPEVGKNYLTRY